ncbi:endonuclease III [Petroclostridium sp. X23]|uniref:endonuclease III n=1 Tax=Petroclostridium sp. X23 TaxID=3045146 RepID=UPI0024AD9777|nr:endonuclease III [Petroclostridium sp. X23]WHH59591.1 endonuclease III [Petroclostridium sp. X23]
MNKKTNDILNILYKTYPDAHCELNHDNAFQLLVATILSAQATDKKVNQVTPKLFEKYKTPQDFLELTQEQLEQEIKEIGLYRSKAKNILQMCRTLILEYNGEVPDNREELMKLAGVGRKTANVVLSNAFNVSAIAVDTHVFRVSNRIGLVSADDVIKTEQELEKTIPKEHWSNAHHLLIFHGRRACSARNPKCHLCPLTEHCNYYNEAKRCPPPL